MMAFGKEWSSIDELRRVCSSVLEMQESAGWKNFVTLCDAIKETHRDRFMHVDDMGSFRENVGTIRGIEKILAIADECDSVMKQDNTNKEI